ncbi:MAG TPA: AraC family transcriptional regulator [Chthonomonadaceae bacterium]|nr:AraC family transcriptional regulator [Chthonomonadaceae bacterium]
MKSEKCAPPRVFTDIPTAITFPRYGASATETPCTVLTAWQTDLQHFPGGEGALAIRWTRNGRRYFESNREQFAVDDSAYLIFNGGRAFSSFVESPSVVSCYCVSYAPDVAEDALRSMVTNEDRLLEDPFGGRYQPVQFFETTYRHNALVTPLLRRLEEAVESQSEPHGWFGEQFRYLIARMLTSHREVLREVARLPAARAATRLEVYRRTLQARDFMEASLDRPLTVSEIASVACFSPFHFLRSFRQVFHETPHQYLTRRRIERAQDLLQHTELSITNVCLDVGFESLGSFSTLFRRHMGVSPERFRSRRRAASTRTSLVKPYK